MLLLVIVNEIFQEMLLLMQYMSLKVDTLLQGAISQQGAWGVYSAP